MPPKSSLALPNEVDPRPEGHGEVFESRSPLLVPPESSSARAPARNGKRRWVRRLHAVAGAVLTLNLFVLLVTGFLVQHREYFKLEDRFVSRTFLPQSYRPQDGADGVRADIVVTDLHSGRILGGPGIVILDAVSVGWLLMLVSGAVLYRQGWWRKENGNGRNGDGER